MRGNQPAYFLKTALPILKTPHSPQTLRQLNEAEECQRVTV